MENAEHDEPFYWLDEGVINRLKVGVPLVIFSAKQFFEGQNFKTDSIAKQFNTLKDVVENLTFIRLFSFSAIEPLEQLKGFEKIARDAGGVKPCLLFVDDAKSSFLQSSCHAIDGIETIRRVLLTDKFLVRVFRDAMQIDLANKASSEVSSDQPPLTPIERALLGEMNKRGMDVRCQIGVGPYVADFIVSSNGTRVVVEADGKAFHDPDADAIRDRRIKSEYGLPTLRFSGSQIYRNVIGCVDDIQNVLSGTIANVLSYADEGMAQLDKSQKAAVKHGGRDARVLAPAGSGKTKVLVNRVVYLLNRSVPPSSILVLAFNKKAAVQLENRLISLGIPVGNGGVENNGVWVATLNSFGFRLIRSEGNTSQLLDAPWKEKSLVEHALNDTGQKLIAMRGEDPIATVTREIARIKRGLFAPKGVSIELPQPKGVANIDLNSIWEHVRQEQAQANIITFDDQIFLAADLLLNEPNIRRVWQGCFTNVLVDEYQDLNPAQILLLQILTAGSASIFAVGDDDQVIYSWRDANVVNLLENFEDSYPGMETYTLETNYRCPKPIVRASQRLIKLNKRRYPKNIKPSAISPEGEIEITHAEGLIKLGEELANFCIRRNRNFSDEWRDMAVLTRTKVQLLAAALALDKANIPRSTLPQVRLFSTNAAKRLTAYFSIACTGDFELLGEDIALVVNQPNRFVRNEDVEKLRSHHNPWMHLNILAYGCQNTIRPNSELKNLINDIVEIRELVAHKKMAPVDIVDVILARFKIAIPPDQSMHTADDATDEIILHLIREVSRNFKNAPEFLEYVRSTADDELSEFKNTVTTNSGETGENIRKDQVTLSTIHGAKGHEWRTVCMFDSSAVSVSTNQTQGIDIEEERRIFYVGMTRSMQCLNISYVSGRPNSFIGEALLPPELIGKESNDTVSWLFVENQRLHAVEKIIADKESSIKNFDAEISELVSGQRLNNLRSQKTDQANSRKQLQAQMLALSQYKPDSLLHRIFKGGKSSGDIALEISALNSRLTSLDNQIMDIDSQITRLKEDSGTLISDANKQKEEANQQLNCVRSDFATISGEIADVILAKDHMPFG